MTMSKFLFHDTLTLIKKTNGEQIEGILAQVNNKGILTYDAPFDLDPGDILVRTRPSGTKENYRVLSPGYRPRIGRIQAHYQAKIEMIGALNTESSPSAGNILVSSDNARFNINSTDNSQNTVIHAEPDQELFQNLVIAAEPILDEVIHSKVIDSINEMSQSVSDKKSLAEKYNVFISSAASHMTVFLPFIPALTKLLSGL
ncbi:MAG: hypothetical protein LBL73_02185 [Synergistaceae bacterium]|jgi:hypothetical protein|nr:hypothetical protein [Synergistaceae bacterium]